MKNKVENKGLLISIVSVVASISALVISYMSLQVSRSGLSTTTMFETVRLIGELTKEFNAGEIYVDWAAAGLVDTSLS